MEKRFDFIFKNKFLLIKGGKGFVGIMDDKLPFKAHKLVAQKLLKKAEIIIKSRKYNLVVLDEINVAISLKLISLTQVKALLASIPEHTDIILTGRYAPKGLVSLADLVTEFCEIKHPYNQGIQGKRLKEY